MIIMRGVKQNFKNWMKMNLKEKKKNMSKFRKKMKKKLIFE